MDAFDEKFGLTRLMQSIENIGFRLLETVKMLNPPIAGSCSAAFTTDDDLAVALSFEGFGLDDGDVNSDFNVNGNIRINNRNTMLNQFYFLDRRHYCLVFESLRSSLYDFMKNHDFQPFPLYCVQDFSYQLLDVLEFLHSIKLIHTDLKPENILLVSDKVKEYTICTNSGCLTNTIVPESTRIKLIDFGGATFDDDYKSSVINTREYRAPEILLKLSTRWSFPSDMWSLGCILAELYTGECLFLASDKYEHFALIDGVVGPFPKHMIEDSPV